MMKPSVLESILKKDSHKKVDAWLGVDSLHGRYMFGVAQVPANGLVDAGQTACITQRVWTWFQGERLFVHRSCAPDFLIRDVFCGCHRAGMSVNDQPIIAEPFAVDFDELAFIKINFDGKTVVTKREDSEKEEVHPATVVQISVERSALKFLGAPFYLPTLPPALDIAMQVENIGKEPRRFLAAFLGKALV